LREEEGAEAAKGVRKEAAVRVRAKAEEIFIVVEVSGVSKGGKKEGGRGRREREKVGKRRTRRRR
jgi:hypothetical protein